MQSSSSPLILKDLLFSPFYGFKRFEPSYLLLFALILLITGVNTADSMILPDWSVDYVLTVVLKLGVNLGLAIISMMAFASFCSFISLWVFGARDVKSWFQLTVICSIPSLLYALVGYAAPFLGLHVEQFNWVIGSPNANITISWISLLAAMWGSYIMAGGIRSKFEVSYTKAWICGLTLSFLPLILFILFATATMPSTVGA